MTYNTDLNVIGGLKDSNVIETAIKSFFNPEDNDGTKYREQQHEWNMPSIERLVELAKTSGLKVKEKVSLTPTSKEYQYLVYFQK